ncbi:NAD(P)H-dependent FMN reductase [Methylacidimicrobium tartarophylax]|uniref:NAD(P)H-dependent FMN reductase n=1 Tax=Methylacidimicrobium tartarophylax TaxID=1041768 RepID=A0A5E6MBU3_9BACT|nr:NAD(P)H-dependent FMN reductase [Methylacidimicrobium tartarophylax]
MVAVLSIEGNKAVRSSADKSFCRFSLERRAGLGKLGLPFRKELPHDNRAVIAILIGTNRLGSRTRLVGAQLVRLYHELGEEARPIDLGLLPIEVGSPRAYADRPAEVSRFAALLGEARGIVVVLPEYNGSFPGILKLFLDLLPHPSPLEGKPICLVGAASGRFGGLRAVEQMQNHLLYRRSHPYPYSVLLSDVEMLLAKTARIEDPATIKRLRAQAEGFLGFVASLAPEKG